MISVIVPYWNAERFIERCINSLKVQTGDLEFILVNDLSEDDSKKIAKRITRGDKRFVHLDNKRTKGVSGARNTGLDKAKGEWITFLDIDDELVPEASEVFERMIRLDPTINILQANHLRHYKDPDRIVRKYANNKGLYHFNAMPMCWCMVWNKLIRRTFLDDIRFVEGLQYGEDELFCLDMFARDDRIIHTMAKTVTVMRHFDNRRSLSRTKRGEQEGLLKQARALEDYILRTDNPEARLMACEVLSEHWVSNTYIQVFGDGEKRK